MHIVMSLAGIALILGVAFALSSDRRAVRLRVVGAAFALQAGVAAMVLYFPLGNEALQSVSHGVSNLLGYAHAGIELLFGPLASPEQGARALPSRACR
jgi:CNT family concentrative nucleoside transporter